MLKEFRADLHVHTALSPCADEEMSPPAILARARAAGLDILAVTDHNSAANTAAVTGAAASTGVTVLPGLELQTREDVHLVCLFTGVQTALEWQEEVYRRLPARSNREDLLGPQLLYDADGKVVGKLDRLLLTAAALSLEEAVGQVRARGGVVIPAHVDRPAYSLLGQLGFLPAELGITACEVSRGADLGAVRGRFACLQDVELVSFSDAHRLADLEEPRTTFVLAAPTLVEIEKALDGRDGRRVVVH